ncbi:hypothetical protein HW537_09350 [Asaia siamensis]
MLQDNLTDQQGPSLSYFGHPRLIERPNSMPEIRFPTVTDFDLTGDRQLKDLRTANSLHLKTSDAQDGNRAGISAGLSVTRSQ